MASSASLARRLGRLQRLDLGLARLHAEEGRARGLRDGAARGLEIVARLLLERQGFLDRGSAIAPPVYSGRLNCTPMLALRSCPWCRWNLAAAAVGGALSEATASSVGMPAGARLVDLELGHVERQLGAAHRGMLGVGAC